MSATHRYAYRVGALSTALLVSLALMAGVLTIAERPAAAISSTITATGRFAYVRPSGVQVGIRNAFVEMCDDDGSFGCPTMATGTTDANGNFTLTGTGSDPDFPFPDPPDPIVKVVATGPSGRVQSTLLADYCFRSATRNNVLPGGVLNFGTMTPNDSFTCDLVFPTVPTTHNGAWQLYNNVREEWEIMRVDTLRKPGRDIPQVRVIWPDNIANKTFYRAPLPTIDEGSISIRPGAEFVEPAIMHEYGHHVMQHFGESPLPDYNNGVCDGISFPGFGGHCLWRAEKGTAAWTEGWPDFIAEFMTTTLGKSVTVSSRSGCDPIVAVCGTIESPPQPPIDPDLAHVEGIVAAILWDLNDANQDNHDLNNSTDRLNLSLSTLWDLYQDFDPDPASAHSKILDLDELWNVFAALRPAELNRVSEIYNENGLTKPAADLTVSAASASTLTVAAGRSLTVTDTTANAGAVRTGTGSVTRLELVPINVFGALTPVGSRNIGDLPPGGSSTGGTTVTIPAGTFPGSYLVRACSDADGLTFETNESNNCRDTARFTVVSGPSNDAFAAAAPISGSSGTTTGTNVAATKEPSEPNHGGRGGGASVWWSWTAPSSGQATIRTAGSSFDTLLGVYTGSAVNQLTFVAGNDDCCAGVTSEVTFPATAGTTYRIAVDGFNAQEGDISLGWSIAPPPSVSIGDATVTEGNSGTVTMRLPVSLSAPSSTGVSVNYGTLAGSATSPADYSATIGTVNFLPGETTKTVPVTVKGDLLDEAASDTFNVVLSGPVGAVIGDGTAVGHITDDDPMPSLRINSVSTAEGQSGTKDLSFTVSLSAASGRAVRFNWATSNGTALAGSDYVTTTGTRNVPAGTTHVSIPVKIKGDLVVEGNETFKVTLSAPAAATIAVASGTGTIVNDD